jgi:hypothetical protein
MQRRNYDGFALFIACAVGFVIGCFIGGVFVLLQYHRTEHCTVQQSPCRQLLTC